MKIRRRVGPKGQIVIPKVVREHLGIKPGDEVIMEVREKEAVLTREINPEKVVDDFCSVVKERLTTKLDLERIMEGEVEERYALR